MGISARVKWVRVTWHDNRVFEIHGHCESLRFDDPNAEALFSVRYHCYYVSRIFASITLPVSLCTISSTIEFNDSSAITSAMEMLLDR